MVEYGVINVCGRWLKLCSQWASGEMPKASDGLVVAFWQHPSFLNMAAPPIAAHRLVLSFEVAIAVAVAVVPRTTCSIPSCMRSTRAID